MNMHQPASTWTHERVTQLLELWGQGGSASEIAKILGGFEHTHDGGRNAVIGKATRLRAQRQIDNVHWSDEDESVLRRMWAAGAKNVDIARKIGGAMTIGAVKVHASRLGLGRKFKPQPRPRDQFGRKPGLREIPPPPCDMEIPQEQRRTFMELEPHHCRWPVGDPQSKAFFFCGAVQAGDGPYCAGHDAVAHL